ncbi:MAG TPA: hypothetical protein VF134_00670 [Candidatus Dormibacteraeota bacterium]
MRPARGQAMVLFTLVLPLVILPAAGYAVEASMLAGRQAALTAATVQAALDATQALDVAAFRAGGWWQLDPSLAPAAAATSLAAADPNAVLDGASVTSNVLTVATHEVVAVPLAIWVTGRKVTVRARVTARLTSGYSSPSSRLPLPNSSFSST